MFKKVESKPVFEVSPCGLVRVAKTKTILKTRKDKDGYLRIVYRIAGKNHHIAPHRAVAECFVENHNKELYNIVNHLDGNKENNNYTNLQWTNASGNRLHALCNGARSVYGAKHGTAKISEADAEEICKMLESGWRNCDIARELDLPIHIISNIKRGKSWRHISEKYDISIPRKDKISKKTKKWIISCLQEGYSYSDILAKALISNKNAIEKFLNDLNDSSVTTIENYED